jgi:hypothetical protein
VTLNAKNEIQLHYEFTNQEPINRLRQKLQSMLEHLDLHPHLIPNNVISGKTYSRRRRRPSIRHLSLRHRSEKFRARRELQGARTGQSLRRGHEFFPSIGAVNPSLTAIANACASATICCNA